MAKTKPTTAGIDRIVDRISHLKRRHERVQAISLLKDSEAWPHLKGLLEDMKGMHERAIKSAVEFGDHLTDAERVKMIDKNKAERDIYEWVVKLVEAPADEAEKLSATLDQLKKDLAEARETQKDFGLTDQKV